MEFKEGQTVYCYRRRRVDEPPTIIEAVIVGFKGTTNTNGWYALKDNKDMEYMTPDDSMMFETYEQARENLLNIYKQTIENYQKALKELEDEK